MTAFSPRAWRAVAAGAGVFLAGLALPRLQARLARPPAYGPVREDRAVSRHLTVVIPAYLEQGVIGATVSDLDRQLAAGPFEYTITVAASDDATAEAAEAAGATVIRQPRRGKAAATNAAIAAAPDGLILLTDANASLAPDNWPDLLSADLEQADLVTGIRLESGGFDQAFARHDAGVKSGSGLVDSLFTVGEFMVFDRRHYRSMPDDCYADDTTIAISFDSRGLRVVIDPRIRATEPGGADFWQHADHRVRMAAGNIEVGLRSLPLLVRTTTGRRFIAHKFYRLTIGPAGFWTAAVAAVFVAPPLTAVLAPAAVAGCLAVYAKPEAKVPGLLRTVATGVALQCFVPPAFYRVLKRAVRGSDFASDWKKISR
jgi:cellulose synthase/poly-beta-1,6-N-acetylglucosamine synthase-like glycosyltransferase